MARILLIKCSHYEGVLTAITFPLGLMYLASAVRMDSDSHDIEIYDMRIKGEDLVALKENINRFKPELVGLSAISVESQNLYNSARAVRETGFDGPVITGGPHPSSFPEETLECEAIDYVALREGEETFREFVDAFDNGKELKNINGIAYRENNTFHYSPPRPLIQDLDKLPFPSYDIVDIEEYSKYMSMSLYRTGKYMSLFTSRACPYSCIYCHSIFGNKFRARSPEKILEEVRHLREKYDIERLEIVDDIFNCNLLRAKKILDLLYQEGLLMEITFPNGLRCDRLDRDFLERLSRFKSPQISAAVETASPRLQRLIGKNLNFEKVNETIDICNDLRIYTRGFFMLGFPTETEEELRATLDFAIKSKLHTALFFLVIPYKGTKLYDLCIQKLRDKDFELADYDYFHSPINCSNIPDKVLFHSQKWINVKFPLSPSRLYRILRDAPNRKFFWHGIKCRLEFIKGAGRGSKKKTGKIPRIKANPRTKEKRKP